MRKVLLVIGFVLLSFFSAYVLSSAFWFGKHVTDLDVVEREIIGFMLPTVCVVPLLLLKK